MVGRRPELEADEDHCRVSVGIVGFRAKARSFLRGDQQENHQTMVNEEQNESVKRVRWALQLSDNSALRTGAS